METIRDYVDVESWFVDELIRATSKDQMSKREIIVPSFQRGIVWNKTKQELLIESIKKGYPIGTLLLYEESNGTSGGKRAYKLIDGLQRTNALKQYSKSPTSFFSKADVPDSTVDILARELAMTSEQGKDSIKRVVTNWVKGVKDFTETAGWDASGITSALIQNVLSIPAESTDYYSEFGRLLNNKHMKNAINEFLQKVRETSDIKKVKIPIIIFSGEASHLPTVFELLNTKGTVLSRYEVFAAQWSEKDKQKIKNKKIREFIWKKYDRLDEESFTSEAYEDATDEKSRREQEYTLFEYLFGFGEYLADKYHLLFKESNDDRARPSSAGFNLLTACTGLRISEMSQLPDRIRGMDRKVLEEWIEISTDFVESTLRPVLSVKQHKRKQRTIYHSEYQIVSMIAAAFQARFDFQQFVQRDRWQDRWGKLKKSLVMVYLYDVLREHWRGSGDSTMFDTVSNQRYLKGVPNKDSWVKALDAWFVDNQINLLHKGRYVKDDNSEILLLKYIYAHKFSVMDNANFYHVEHIIPVKQLQKLKAADEKLAINMISNLALLDPSRNTKKGDLTFQEYLNKQLNTGKISLTEFDKQIKDFEDQLLCDADILPTDLSRKTYEDFLQDRFDQLREEFLRVWRDHIPADPQT